jgi:SAM-dependent methyltransferase
VIDPDQLPPGFGFHVAHPARVYNVWIGGKDHFAADREAAARVIKHRPQVVDAAIANRQFLGRAVKYLARSQGIRQFLDIGAGLPASGATHEVAQGVDRWSRVVYVDHDPLVIAHARALLTSTDEGCCDYVQADLRDTEYVLREAARTLDMRRAVAVLLVAVLHFVPDADDPAELVRALTRPLAPGSCVVISHLTADSAPEAVGQGVAAYNAMVSTSITARSHAKVTGLLGGLQLIAPGVVRVAEWRPDKICGEVTDVYAGVARKALPRW